MLSMSAADDVELENWRSRYGRCRLPPKKMRAPTPLNTVLERLPPVMASKLRSRLEAGGWLGALRLEGAEVAEIEKNTRMNRVELMVMLLDIASALAQTPVEGEHIGAIGEGQSGGIYVGAPVSWKNDKIKFSVHGVQAAVLNAWCHGEKFLTRIMVEVQPCACCRQFLRELRDWKTLKILQALEGPFSLRKGEVQEIDLSLEGLKMAGIKAGLMNEPRRSIALARSSPNELIKQAAAAAALSYAPYSRNYAGVALRTKRGDTHYGCYVETSESVAGVLAAEAALVDLVLGGSVITDVSEMVLVETRGGVTQFPSTQRLAMAMGNVPFRFLNAT